MSHLRAVTLAAFALAAIANLNTAPVGAAQNVTRTLYVSVIEKDGGNPVLDMKAADFEVKEGGKVQQISTLKVADLPLRVALIVSDRGTGGFQLGALRFVEALLGHGEIAITGIVTQPERYSDYSGNVDVLREGLIKLARRGGTGPGAQVVETLMDAAKEVSKEGFRPVIVLMRNGGEGSTPIRAEAVREQLRKSGAALYAISTTGTQGIRSGGANEAVTAASVAATNAASEVQEGMLTLGTIIGDGSKDSGGHHEQVVSTSLVPTMQQIAKELLNEYKITYTLPAGTKPNDRVSVTTKRKGVTVYAPSRIGS